MNLFEGNIANGIFADLNVPSQKNEAIKMIIQEYYRIDKKIIVQKSIVLFFLLFIFASMLSAVYMKDSYAEIIPQDRRIDWSPGIPGGIPNYPVGVNAKDYGAVGDGSTNDTNAIQDAINACPEGQVVYLPEGTYKTDAALSITNGIVLRGDGPDKTFIKNDASSGSIIRVSSSGRGSAINILSGYTKDSTSIIVEDASSLSVGDYIVIYQDNDDTIPVDPVGCGGNCGWCGLFDDENHAMAQILKITDKSDTMLTLNRPLYFTFKAALDPEVIELTMLENAGVEDLYIEMTTAGSGMRDGIYFNLSAHCWVRNVETNKIRNNHVCLRYSYGNEIRQSYFHHGWGDYPGSWAYGVMMYFVNSDHLIEDNIFYVLRHAMVLEGGGSGNVFAYNYSKDSQGNVGSHWLFPDMITHGAHPYMNLFEGNRGVKLNFDNYWGSSSHNTAFRNWVERRSDPPEDYINSGIWAIDLQANSHYQNIVGNIFGYPGCTGTIWSLGSTCPSGGAYDPEVENTLIRHGNYDYVTDTAQWDSTNPDRDLPNSLYLSSKPSFFGNLPWPSFGPDLNSMAGDLPAQLRFEEREIPALLGDLNNDTRVDVLDMQACVNHILGIQDWGSMADFNEDGSVNVQDIQCIVNIIL